MYLKLQVKLPNEGVKQVFESILKESKEKQVYGFVGTEALNNLFDEDFVFYYPRKRAEKGIHWTAITGAGANSQAMQKRDKPELRTTHILPEGYDYGIECASYDDKTIIVSFDKENPLGIKITDQKIADMIKTIVRYIASTLK